MTTIFTERPFRAPSLKSYCQTLFLAPNGVQEELGNPKLVSHPARPIKEGGCEDLSMDTMHLKDPLVLFGFEGSALSLHLFLLSPIINMLIVLQK